MRAVARSRKGVPARAPGGPAPPRAPVVDDRDTSIVVSCVPIGCAIGRCAYLDTACTRRSVTVVPRTICARRGAADRTSPTGAAAAGGAGQRPHTSHVCVLLRSVRRLVPLWFAQRAADTAPFRSHPITPERIPSAERRMASSAAFARLRILRHHPDQPRGQLPLPGLAHVPAVRRQRRRPSGLRPARSHP